jgi:YidC/Oxa1 family membrane protein insertase
MNIFQILLIQPLANGLALFYQLLGGNMGLAIIAFSTLLKLVLTPFTNKSLENMKRMQELRPGLQKIQERHKGDRAKLMQAQSDYYKEHGFNPGAGCLPQILQLVVLYAFYGVFSSVLTAGENITATFNSHLYEPLKFAADTHINTQFLYLDVTKPDVISIPGIPTPLPGLLLILSALSQVISAKIAQPYIEKEKKIAQKTEESTDDMAVAMQSSMLIMMPLLTLIIGMQFPSGLALYWLVFSILQAYQQYRITGLGGLTSWLKRINVIQ